VKTPTNLPDTKTTNSQTAKTHLNLKTSLYIYFCQLANARTAKKLPRQSVASMDQNLPTEQTHFFSTSAVNDVNFQQTLQREAF